MPSIVEHVYPRVVWRNREKKLWNPIHKKVLKNLPEERVRLRVIEALMKFGWSKNRISTEEAIGKIGDKAMRTDIICYDQQFEPKLLVECKAEYIPISEKTAAQVGRYNRKVKAPYLLLTNGVNDFWYAIDRKSENVESLTQTPPFITDKEKEWAVNFDHWKSRGFAGSNTSPKLKEWITTRYPGFWLSGDQNIQYLSFGEGPSDIDLSHYYQIHAITEERRIAFTTLNTAYGGNRMIIILNVEDDNKAVLEINIDLLNEEREGNSALYSKAGISTFNIGDYWNLWQQDELAEIVAQADHIFAEHLP
ncbi:type I restriction enzyme HsdR N-terminal domain-containing protein [Fodinibius saliphilus]|uniref:type I restriction enzyme HsdR N-terminal domain-containing protein n=1 Tax=Fodinibius saliphilus TaxID=1920650 RepID=UPI0011082ABE|nr:type I restriction enzyme HsdR N-terminal domain-containing protein [Fodinibius saliphilus]